MDVDILLESLIAAGSASLESLRGDASLAVEASIVNLLDGLPAPAFIPVFQRRDGTRVWYGLGGPHFDAAEILELTKSCIEPGLGTVTAAEDIIDPGALAAAVAEHTGGRWVQIDVPPGRHEAARLLSALASNLRRRSDHFPRAVLRDLDHVLRDLDTAIHVGDHERTSVLLAELEQLPGLTADNRCYLLVDARSRAQRPVEALCTTGLTRLLDALPPAGVRRAVLTSVHAIMSKDDRVDPSIDGLDRGLFEVLEKIVLIPPRDIDDHQAEVLVTAIEAGLEVRCDDVASARAAASRAQAQRLEGQIARAGRTAAVTDEVPHVEDPLERVSAALAALDLRRVEAIAAEHPEVAAHPMVASLLSGRSPQREGVATESTPAANPEEVESWECWIERAMDGTSADLRTLAVEGLARAWPVPDAALEALSTAIGRADTDQANRLRRGLVHLLDAAGDLGHQTGRNALIAAVRLVEAHPPTSEAEEEAVISWCDTLGRLGMGDEQADELLLYVTLLLDRLVDRWRMAWAVDLLLGLTRSPTIVRSDAIADVWNILQSDAMGYADAIPVEVKESLADVARNLGYSLPPPLRPIHVGGADPLTRLSTESIAIHTLTVSAAQAARDAILLAAPDVRVTINDDKKATERLRALAVSADYFLFTSRSCQHAASGALFEERSRSRPVLQVAGTGKSSILRRLREEVGAQAGRL